MEFLIVCQGKELTPTHWQMHTYTRTYVTRYVHIFIISLMFPSTPELKERWREEERGAEATDSDNPLQRLSLLSVLELLYYVSVGGFGNSVSRSSTDPAPCPGSRPHPLGIKGELQCHLFAAAVVA